MTFAGMLDKIAEFHAQEKENPNYIDGRKQGTIVGQLFFLIGIFFGLFISVPFVGWIINWGLAICILIIATLGTILILAIFWIIIKDGMKNRPKKKEAYVPESYSFSAGNNTDNDKNTKKLKDASCTLIQESKSYIICVRTPNDEAITATYRVPNQNDLTYMLKMIMEGWVQTNAQESIIFQANKILNNDKPNEEKKS